LKTFITSMLVASYLANHFWADACATQYEFIRLLHLAR